MSYNLMPSNAQDGRTHTPGDWQISRVAAGKNGTSLAIWRNDQGPNAPDDSPNTGHVTIAQHIHNEADARLIAAAPDLLAALIAAEDRMAVVLENDTDEGKPEDAALVSAFKAARAAIAKATGDA